MLFIQFQTASQKLHDFLQFVFMYLTWPFAFLQYPCFFQYLQCFPLSVQLSISGSGGGALWSEENVKVWFKIKKHIITMIDDKRKSEIYGILIPKVNSYQMHDFHISCFWMGIPCKPNTGSTYCSSSTAYPCNLCLCCNTIFHCCTHICVSSGIVLK